jgi:hypothetical protein
MMQTPVREKGRVEMRYHRDKINWNWNPMDELNSKTLFFMLEKRRKDGMVYSISATVQKM